MSVNWNRYAGGNMNTGYSFDQSSGRMGVHYSQPVDKIIRNNQHRRSTEDNSQRRRDGRLYQIAEIPVGIVHEWKVKYGVDVNERDHWPAVMQLIQSRDYNAAVAVADGNFLARPVRTHFAASRAAHPLTAERPGASSIIRSGVF